MIKLTPIILPLVLFLLNLSLVTCTKDRLEVSTTDPTDTTQNQITAGYLYINEFVAKGSANTNEFGSAEDWLEIYNPQSVAVTLTAGSWYVSDGGPSDPMKYLIPEVTIPAGGFLVIWCDGLDTMATQIHSNFGLSASGEHLVLYYQKSGSASGVVVDEHQYGIQTVDGQSEGRYPDGSNNWVTFGTPTIGSSNN